MKITDVPKQAFTAEPTPIPMRAIPDWDALHEVLKANGFVVIEDDAIRTNINGSQEGVKVKNFNSFVRNIKRQKLFTKRISNTRWVCTLGAPVKDSSHTLTPRVVDLLHRQSQYLKQEERDAIALRLAALNTEGELR